jgi:DNA polymerase III epsilon subunit-like protein
MTHVMVDLETLGTAPNAAIIQLGAVKFALEGPEVVAQRVPGVVDNFFEATVAAQSAIFAGGSVDPDTVAWWRQRPEQTRAVVESDAERLCVVLSRFAHWLGDVEALWAHGASFDVPILESAFRSLGLSVPWRYTKVRDTRTLFWAAESLSNWKRPRRETAHTALADAVAQAEDVRQAWRALKKLNEFKAGFNSAIWQLHNNIGGDEANALADQLDVNYRPDAAR